MSLELDWLEREERYRRRVVRLMWIFVILAGGLLTWSAISHSRAEKRQAKAAEAAAIAAREADEKRVRDAYSADSTDAATRLSRFMDKYQPEAVENSRVLAVPIPVGMPVRSFLEQVWSDYARVLEPQATAVRETELFRQYFVDVMNDGPLRPRAILVPPWKQDKTKIVADRPSFPDITRGQVAVGYREPPPEPADSLAAGTEGAPAEGVPAEGAPAEAAPAAAGAEEVPGATDAEATPTGEPPAVEATPPAPTEMPAPAVSPVPAEPAPPDTTPKG